MREIRVTSVLDFRPEFILQLEKLLNEFQGTKKKKRYSSNIDKLDFFLLKK